MKASAKQYDKSTIGGRDHCKQSPVKKREGRTLEPWINLNLIPDHDTEAVFAERLFIPLEERGVVKWLLAARANETLPTPFATERLNSPHPISNTFLTPLTLRHPQPHMTVLAIWMPLVHRECYVRVFECSVSREAPVAGCRGRWG